MKIELVHSEMKKALVDFVISQGIDISGKAVDVHMVAGRGTNGFTANISIVPPEEADQNTNSVDSDDLEESSDSKDPISNDAESAPGDSVTLFP